MPRIFTPGVILMRGLRLNLARKRIMPTEPALLTTNQLLRNLLHSMLSADGNPVTIPAAVVEEDQTTERFILMRRPDGDYDLARANTADQIIV